jgi:hypothetical protein
VKRTRQSICAKKRRYGDEAAALEAMRKASVVLRHYRCDRCGLFHLTGRTKGKFGHSSSLTIEGDASREIR